MQNRILEVDEFWMRKASFGNVAVARLIRQKQTALCFIKVGPFPKSFPISQAIHFAQGMRKK